MTAPKRDEEAILEVARKIAGTEARQDYLRQVCGEDTALCNRVQGLLQVHDEDNGILATDAPSLADTLDVPLTERPGTIIGPYKLLEQIGEGGFGIVFTAEQQQPVRRKVALKVLKPGMDTRQVIARFEAERQALALMDHPHIARVFDGGETASGRPYFVMELVRGVPITVYCDQGHLPVRARLELFVTVCQAIQHAHHKGIIHRDLKPSNILVTMYDDKAVVKVIDFGIAKAIGQQLTEKTLFTNLVQMIGTPMYMSPEQAQMSGLDVDTRSDVYALGVLLYELLSGTTPFDRERLRTAAFDEIRRIIREEEPPRPSTRLSTVGQASAILSANRQSDAKRLSQLFRVELDWIVMKALEKDRNRRYDSASAFAADVQRYLQDDPVLACPPSAWYRLSKIVRRHKVPVLAASLVVLALVSGIIGTTWGLIRATQSERNARGQLFLSLLNQARAGRFSRQMGQRLASLDALAKAASLRPDERLRDEAIAAMVLPDLRFGPSWHALPPGSQSSAPDSHYRLYASDSDLGVISIRSLPDDREIESIVAAPTKVGALQLSPDGRYLARLEDGYKLRVWRLADRESVLREEPRQIFGWTFSPDSRQLAVGQQGWILRFDMATGRELNRWQLPKKTSAYGLAFHPDNRQLAVGYADASVASVYDATTGNLIADLPVGATRDQVVAWHPDGVRLAIAGSQFLQVWSVPAKRLLATLKGDTQQITHLTFHPDGQLLASNSWDGVLRLWDPATGRQLMQLPLIVSPQFSIDGRWLGVARQGEQAQLLEVTTSPEYRTFVSGLGAGKGVYVGGDVSPDGRLLAMNIADYGVPVWQLDSGRELALLPPGIPLFEPDGRELLTCGPGGLLRWPIQIGAAANELRLGPPRTISPMPEPTRAALGQDGQTLALVSEAGGGGLLVDLATESVRAPLLEHPKAVYVDLSRDGRWMASSGWHSDRIRLWNAKIGKLVNEWTLSRATVFFTPDSRVLIIGEGHEFSFWDLATLQPIRRLHRDVTLYPGHVAFSSDGKLMALEMAPGVIHLQEVATGRTVAKLEDPNGDRAGWMGFTPDRTQLVVVAYYAQAIHVWDLRAIRQRLKGMGLDWNWPEFAPAAHVDARPPLSITVELPRSERSISR
jgi:serine/threonine protein kinase/WD40 repeat protein